jgi:electron transfer flavoprotein alpha subunit
MPDILVYSDKQTTALELVSGAGELAEQLGLGLSAATLGPDAGSAAEELAAFGASRVFASEHEALEGLAVDIVAEALRQIAEECEAVCVIVGSTRRGKELAPRLAQKLKAGCVTDVNSLMLSDGALVATRYAFGGATVAEEVISTPLKVFAVMPKTFEVRAAASAGGVMTLSLTLAPSAAKVVSRRPKEGTAVDLQGAARIVGAGRGVAKKEDLEIVRQLAAALDAELGCTKGVADLGWLPEERVIGLSGVKTKCDLYVAVGISGQIQHTVGISSANTIVAINKDKDAPMFGLCDYCIVGDLYEVVPALIDKLGTM